MDVEYVCIDNVVRYDDIGIEGVMGKTMRRGK